MAGEAAGLGTSRPELLTAVVQAAVPMQIGNQSWVYSGFWYGQWSRTPLVIQDRLALGGRYSVRGFDADTPLVGDNGWFLRNDLALVLGSGQQAYVALDYGRIGRQAEDASLRGDRLAGAALGLRGRVGRWNWDGFVGVPVDKPEGLRADPVTTGLSLGWNY